jgi:hypothetical protein
MNGNNDTNSNDSVVPEEVREYLDGVDYPATKQDLLEYAQSQGAPQEVVDFLDRMEEKEYGDPGEVLREAMGGWSGRT